MMALSTTPDTFETIAGRVNAKLQINKKRKFKTLIGDPTFLQFIAKRYVTKNDTIANMAYVTGCTSATLSSAIKTHYRIASLDNLAGAVKQHEMMACVTAGLGVDESTTVDEIEMPNSPTSSSDSDAPVSVKKGFGRRGVEIPAKVLKRVTREYKTSGRPFNTIASETAYNPVTLCNRVCKFNGVTRLSELRNKPEVGKIERLTGDVEFVRTAASRYYNGERLADIAKERNVQYGVLRYAMMNNGITLKELRNPGNHPIYRNIKRNTNEYINNRNWLVENYVLQKYSIADLCRMSGCSRPLVKGALEKFGIRERTSFEESVARNDRIYFKRAKEIYDRYCGSPAITI
ncbi:MAG: hypothetical protein WC262_10775 [Bacteroidales bacterium]|jgi:hypothetical protein